MQRLLPLENAHDLFSSRSSPSTQAGTPSSAVQTGSVPCAGVEVELPGGCGKGDDSATAQLSELPSAGLVTMQPLHANLSLRTFTLRPYSAPSDTVCLDMTAMQLVLLRSCIALVFTLVYNVLSLTL